MIRQVCAVLAAVAVASNGGAAAAQPGGPEGTPCGLTAVDGRGAAGTRAGELHGGPLAGSGTLTCTVQLGDATHAGRDAASARAIGSSVVVIWPTAVTFAANDLAAYVCTSFTDARGTTLYWDASGGVAGGGTWTPDSGARCARAAEVAAQPVARAAGAAFCATVATAAPGVPGVVSVGADGDVSVAGRRALDCDRRTGPHPPDSGLPDPTGVTGAGPAGRITITDNGTGPLWVPTGDLADPSRWNCYQQPAVSAFGVVCDWVGGPAAPACTVFSALAVALPDAGGQWGSADTWAICEGDVVAEYVDSGAASQTPPFTYGERLGTHQALTSVYCQARGAGSLATAQPRYLAECGFQF